MIISSCRSHSSRLDVVGDDLTVFGKWVVADSALSALLGDLPAEQLADLLHAERQAVAAAAGWLAHDHSRTAIGEVGSTHSFEGSYEALLGVCLNC